VCLEAKACEKRAQEAQDGMLLTLTLCGSPVFHTMVQTSTLYFMNHLQAARETGALKEAKDKLEKRVEELTWRLGLEKRLRVVYLHFLYFSSYLDTGLNLVIVGLCLCS
jgi:hypothetical protein